jgi:hypothetical protein
VVYKVRLTWAEIHDEPCYRVYVGCMNAEPIYMDNMQIPLIGIPAYILWVCPYEYHIEYHMGFLMVNSWVCLADKVTLRSKPKSIQRVDWEKGLFDLNAERYTRRIKSFDFSGVSLLAASSEQAVIEQTARVIGFLVSLYVEEHDQNESFLFINLLGRTCIAEAKFSLT